MGECYARLEGWIQQRGVFYQKATDISIAQKMYTLIYQYVRKSPNDRFCAQHGGKNKKKKAGVPFTRRPCIQDLDGLRRALCFPFIKRPLCLKVALGAHADVLDIVFQIDGDLLAFKDKLPVDPAAVAGSLAPAGTDGLHLLNGVGQLQQTGGTGEALEGEV